MLLHGSIGAAKATEHGAGLGGLAYMGPPQRVLALEGSQDASR